MATKQLHGRLSCEQVKDIFVQYQAGTLTLQATLAQLGLKRRRFFILFKQYRECPDTFTTTYTRATPKRLSKEAEEKIQQVIREDEQLVKDKRIPVRSYNYTALQERLKSNYQIHVSRTTVVARAKEMGCYLPKRERRVHDREVLTNNIGELIQHDSSHHLWSPYAQRKWYLITSLDDHSRQLLYAQLFEQETSWKHILALQSLVLTYGVPRMYYADQHGIFRFVERRDRPGMKSNLKTDEVTPQWKQAVIEAGSDVTYALSPQAKGKIERPYRWLQDRLVRTCANEHVTSLGDARLVLQDEVHRYNHVRVHSTTKEIPHERFHRARTQGRTFFHPLHVDEPYDPVKDVFCLKIQRMVDSYRTISLKTVELKVPIVPPRQLVTLHLVPDQTETFVEVRMWWKKQLVSTQNVKADLLKGVQF